MQVRAIAKGIGISPRKMRLVTRVVKGLELMRLWLFFHSCPMLVRTQVRKVVASAAANAENNYNLDPDELYILNIVADDAFRAKRAKARSHGRSSRIIRRYCHVTVIVSDDPADAGR